MITVKGIYNGKEIKALEELPKNKSYKVLITFLEEISEEEDIRNYYSRTDSFSFWEDPREDIYQDYLKNKKDEKKG